MKKVGVSVVTHFLKSSQFVNPAGEGKTQAGQNIIQPCSEHGVGGLSHVLLHGDPVPGQQGLEAEALEGEGQEPGEPVQEHRAGQHGDAERDEKEDTASLGNSLTYLI
jgi:hypothetical protein